MKCVGCGAENTEGADTCAACAMPLIPGKPEMSDPDAGPPAEARGAGYTVSAEEGPQFRSGSRQRQRRRAEVKKDGMPLPLLVLLLLLGLAAVAVGAYFLWQVYGPSSAEEVALEYMRAVEEWDAERVWELTNPKVRGDKATFVADMKSVREEVKGVPILKGAEVKGVEPEGETRAIVMMEYQVLRDPAKKTYETTDIELDMLRKDGQWYYDSGAL